MDENGHTSFPLTTAQRGLWFSQKLAPGAIMSIAEAVEICGPIKPQLFQKALHRLISEAEELRVNIVERDGKPTQIARSSYQGDFPYLDMSGEANPRASIYAWMREELARPIDLAKDPLWVSALLKASDSCYFWYQRAHHIAYDGYGGGLVARRLSEIYNSYVRGEEPAPNTFCPMDATLEVESNYRQSDRFQRDREYWHQQLAQLPEAVTLSKKNHRQGLSNKLLRSTGHLSIETARGLSELGKQLGASLPQVLIGLIAAYYQRLTAVDDLVFSIPVSGRISSVLRRSVTVSANVVPIRLWFAPETTATELFAQVARTVRQALRHQQYRYEDLRRDMGLLSQGQNLAWLSVNIEPFDYRLSFDGAPTISHNMSNSSIDDLTVFVYDRGTDSDLRFDLDANPALYTQAELDEHRRRLARLMEQVLAHPEMPLGQIDILGVEERSRLLIDWNDTAAPLSNTSVPDFVAQWAKETPDVTAVVFEGTQISYRELHERSVRQAQRLIARGVKPGDIVAVALPRSEKLLITLLAIMRAGAAYLPLDLDGPVDRMTLVLEDAAPSVLIAQPQMFSHFSRGSYTLLQLEDLDNPVCDSQNEPNLSTPESVAYVLYTSGSTGKPKGVQVTHHNLNNFLQAMRYHLRPISSDRFLAVTTLIFDIAGLELYLPLTVGARVIMASGRAQHNPPLLAKLIQNSGATHMQATPSLWRILLAYAETRLDNVHVLVGGEALSAELASRLMSMAETVTQLYGPTETTIWSTIFQLDKVGEMAPPIGRPILNTQLYVLDEDRQLIPTGAIGELYIGGDGVAKGYLNRPELNQERFLPNPFAQDGSRMYRTGDLVRWTEDGLLEFIGRADNQVKINGHRIELGEIENLLLNHVTVAEAAVTAHRGSDGTASLAAYVVPSSGILIDTNTLRQFLAGRVPSYMVPNTFMVLEAMPLTPNGKLDRKALPIPERASVKAYAEPVTLMEKKLAALWQETLRVERVGLHDNFFEMGGDSLKAAEIVAHFPARFDMELPLGSLFEAPTIAELAALVERLGTDATDPLDIVLPLRQVSSTTQRPLFCIHPIAGISMGFSALLRHLDPTVPVYGLQSRGLRGDTKLPGSIEEIAADYLAHILRIQPHGPYRLVGRSLGGLIAHCIAEQMRAQDMQVELLAMIDSSLFIGRNVVSPLTGAEEVRAALSFLNIQLSEEHTAKSLKELGEFLFQPDNARLIPQVQGIMKVAKQVAKSKPEFVNHLLEVMLNNLKVARQYSPRAIDTDLLYFHASQVTGNLEGILERSPSAWRPFINGQIEIHELQCHHEEVLDLIPAAQIGSVLRKRLSRSVGMTTEIASAVIPGEAEAISGAWA